MLDIIILIISYAILYNVYLYSKGKLAYQVDRTSHDKRYIVNEFGKKCPINIEKWGDDENYCTVDHTGSVYLWKEKPRFLPYSHIWFSEKGSGRYYCYYGQKLYANEMYIWERPD